MDFKILETRYNGKIFRIEEDYPEVGSYLYFCEGEICLKDYLQIDIESCKQMAFKYFGVPIDSWVVKKEQ